jgi:uncharacterized protein (TIRG00374 family)
MGDAYRAHLLGQAARSSFSACLGTVAAERVLDIVVVFGMLLVALTALTLDREAVPSLLFPLAGLAMLLAALLAVLLMARFGTRLRSRLPRRLQGVYQGFHLGALGSFKRLPLPLALGAGGWLLEAGRLLLAAQALGLSLSIPLALFVALVHALLTALPLTPGALGIAEPGMAGLLALGLPAGSAVSLAVLDRSISYLSVVVLGGLAFLVRQGLLLGNRRAAAPPVEGT